ncbi:MAG: FAD-dependent oxidoreductase, partial [Allopontixanthobacter sediminis]
LYPALGSEIRSELAGNLGVELGEEGCLVVDAHQRTDIEGLYAAGDVVLGLDQLSHAIGEGGVAATTIRNDLAKLSPLRRPDLQAGPSAVT